MTDIMDMRRALVVGLGTTGLSAARWLAARGLEVAVTDSRARPPQLDALSASLPDAGVFVGGFSTAALDRADLLVLSPGVPLADPYVREACARGIPIVGDVELFARTARAPVVAITGSNGKSTVTTLVARMAERAGRDVRVGGNLGTPALDLVGASEPELYVLELSSFQLETTSSLAAAAAAVLNLSEDHLDRYADMDEYGAAKARIWRGDGVVVANRDDPRVRALVPGARDVRWFGLGEPADARSFGLRDHHGEPWLCRGDEPLIPRAQVRIAGSHNAANALAALALGNAIGLPDAPMLDVLRSFGGLPHRMTHVGVHGGVSYYDDSKATNVGAAVAAISGMDVPLVLVLGGDGKGQDFAPLAAAMHGRARAAVLLGRDAPRLADALRGVCGIVEAADMESAVARAAALARPGDAVLLSPACSSLDMFTNFEARGDAFAAAVRGLG